MVRTLSTEEAAHRLGVKVDTLYAYVSRGVLTSRRDPSSRTSRFDAEEVERLARRGRPRRSTRPPALDLEIHTRLTRIADDHLELRGHDAARLAVTVTYEQAAELLWTGALPEQPPAWRAPAVPAVPEIGGAAERLRIAVTLAAAADPLRGDLRPDAVAATARGLIATLVGVLAAPSRRAPRLVLPDSGTVVTGSIAARTWVGLRRGATASDPTFVPIVNAALVLLADHELAASTLAARVAASTRADPYAVVMAGLGPLAGPLHGGASRAVRRLLDDAARSGPARALTDALATYGTYPGFGHRLYRGIDPRARVLLDLLRASAPDRHRFALVDDVLALVRRHRGVEPNVDYALGALGFLAGLDADCGEVLFTIARSAGWIAHALEEYQEAPVRFRPRGVYVRSVDG